ncbi:MAG: response regulator [Actinomycetota bacterium]|nr:response regulator [Actinomycetota bacterium]
MLGKKVLVIDDEPAIHKLLQTILEHEGFQIMGLEERKDTRETVARRRPDVIILDIMMPEVDGFQILKMLKEDEETRDIPVLVLTVRSLREDREMAMALGADLYMTKPFQPSELVEVVRSLAGA